MRATGIIRRVDDLGRIVIPKKVRESLNIVDGAPMELYIDYDNDCVIFQKYDYYESSIKAIESTMRYVSEDSDLDICPKAKQEALFKMQEALSMLKKSKEQNI